MATDREEDATGITPQTLSAEMGDATQRLREQAWKITALTSPAPTLIPGADLTEGAAADAVAAPPD